MSKLLQCWKVTYSSGLVMNDYFGILEKTKPHGPAWFNIQTQKKDFQVNSQSPATTPQLQQAPRVEPAASTVSPLSRFEKSFWALRALRVVSHWRQWMRERREDRIPAHSSEPFGSQTANDSLFLVWLDTLLPTCIPPSEQDGKWINLHWGLCCSETHFLPNTHQSLAN